MDFSLSEEQVLLRESVEKYVADNAGVERHRRLSCGEMGFDPAAWAIFAELGWLALPFAGQDGGLDGSATDLMVLCEGLGRGLVREPYLHTAITCGGILSSLGSAKQRADHLPPLMEGRTHWALASAEPGSGFSLEAVDTTARRDRNGYLLDGRKITVLNGHVAHQLLVTARDGDGVSLFIVDSSLPGVGRDVFSAVDGSRGAHVLLEQVQVPHDSLLGDPGLAPAAIARALDLAIVAMGAEAVGAMQVLLDTTVEYTRTREQFGQPIGRFQALQHRMADMYLKLEETRSLLYNAAILVEEQSPESPAACAALKVKLAEAGRLVSHEAVQLHGGIGMTDELAVGHLFKRLMLLSKLYGDGDWHLNRYLELSAA